MTLLLLYSGAEASARVNEMTPLPFAEEIDEPPAVPLYFLTLFAPVRWYSPFRSL